MRILHVFALRTLQTTRRSSVTFVAFDNKRSTKVNDLLGGGGGGVREWREKNGLQALRGLLQPTQHHFTIAPQHHKNANLNP